MCLMSNPCEVGFDSFLTLISLSESFGELCVGLC